MHTHFFSKHRKKFSSVLVYGGSFDPLHLGHIHAIKLALSKLNPNLCLLVPAFNNPFKPSSTYSPHQRVKWLKRALKSEIKSPKTQICLFEIRQNRPTPTIYTIRYLKKRYNISHLYFLLGADNASHLHTWDHFKELNSLVEFVFLTREGYPLPPHFPYPLLHLEYPVSSTQIKKGEQKEFLPHFLQSLR